MALKCLALIIVSAPAFQAFPIVVLSGRLLVGLMALGMEWSGFTGWKSEQLLPMALHIRTTTGKPWIPVKCPGQKCLSISCASSDQREASCPLQDPHLLPFGHSAANLRLLYLQNKKQASGEGAELQKCLWAWDIMSFWFWQIYLETF